eukprot:10923053-Alexandrium_andersonii.AAC.1
MCIRDSPRAQGARHAAAQGASGTWRPCPPWRRTAAPAAGSRSPAGPAGRRRGPASPSSRARAGSPGAPS